MHSKEGPGPMDACFISNSVVVHGCRGGSGEAWLHGAEVLLLSNVLIQKQCRERIVALRQK